MEQKPGLYIKTYGCQMNQYDTLKLQKILEQQYQTVDSAEAADLVLINTCSVRDKPEQKLYSLLGELSELKQEKPNFMVGVCGCVAQQEGEHIVNRSSVVDMVFGTHNLSLVPSLIESRKSGLPPQVAINYREDWEDLPLGFPEIKKVTAFVSISRGCNKNCSYCIVPTTRGKEVSRDPSEIEREIRIAVHGGVKEIMLLGQTVNSYGLDFTPRQSFASLLERVSNIEGLERIRFISPHPQEVKKDFIELVCSNPKICRHIHLPLQSGSDQILKSMNRNYRKKRYLEIVSELKSRVPDMGITTDIIVGFPGETDADFEETLSVMNEVMFDNSFSYIFSPRPGTKAEHLPEQLSYDVKLKRLQALQALQFEHTQKRLQEWVGKKGEVLIEAKSEHQQIGEDSGTLWQGRLSQNLMVNVNDEPFQALGKTLKPGMIVDVEITKAARYSLKGRCVIGSTDSSDKSFIVSSSDSSDDSRIASSSDSSDETLPIEFVDSNQSSLVY